MYPRTEVDGINSYFTREHATAYELTGWVRNTKEGKVSEPLHYPTDSISRYPLG